MKNGNMKSVINDASPFQHQPNNQKNYNLLWIMLLSKNFLKVANTIKALAKRAAFAFRSRRPLPKEDLMLILNT
jgi:hypothetical protein